MFNKIYRNLLVMFVSFCLLEICGCSYSFTGASVPAHLKTIAIPFSVDKSNSGVADLSENFTNELNQRFLEDNSLQVTDKVNADAVIECSISRLTDMPTVISGPEKVTARKVTINVFVVYKDLVKRKRIFERSFTSNYDYQNIGDIIEARDAAIIQIIKDITEDILLAVVSNW